MPKKRTNKQKYGDYADAIKAINEGRPVKRQGTKDGSIATHPVVDVPDLPEREVLKDCLEWLKRKGIFCNRHDAATLQNDRGQWGAYGIKGAGDIIGMLRPSGRHFEIECKKGKGGRLSLEQQKRKLDVMKNNGIYIVAHGQEELEHYMRGYHVL